MWHSYHQGPVGLEHAAVLLQHAAVAHGGHARAANSRHVGAVYVRVLAPLGFEADPHVQRQSKNIL